MSQKTQDLFEFGPFLLDSGKHQLLREGNTVPLTPKTFDLLLLLVENHSRMLSKQELIKTLWPDSFVDESNLTQQVAMIRRALGESAGQAHYVTTVPARGYRFTAEVKRRPSSDPKTAAGPPNPPGRRTGRYRRIAAIGALIVASLALYAAFKFHGPSWDASRVEPRSLAILPFQNLKNDGENDFLGFSLADAVITKLGPVQSLSVRPSSAIAKYRGKTIDLRAAAADLRVDALLTGNFVHDGDDLRITCQLADVRMENILWRSSIDLKYNKLLAVHDSVAHEIVKGLKLSLSPSEAASLKPDRQVAPVAYEYYLRGIDLYSRSEFATAIEMLRKSVEVDPTYALMWAHLGRTLTANASFELGGRQQYQEAQRAYENALAIDPGRIETRIFMANLLTDTGKVEQSLPLLRDALKTNPNHAEVHWELGYAYRFSGMLSESVVECERARSLDPGVKLHSSALNAYLYLGQYDKFLKSLPEDSDSPLILFYRGFAEYHRHRFEQAAQYFDAAFQARPSMLQAKTGKALSAGLRRQKNKGLEMLRAMEQQIANRGVGDPEAVYKIAQAYAALGDLPSALRALRTSIENGFFSFPYFTADPLLDPLRGSEEFARLMALARKRHEAFRAQFFPSIP
jgi:DNA-binding winged helix-turn-helix (wHTH) protein/TolB-like protein/Flp pilus assembly protein TadD